jgi:hypothetical protein
MKLRECIGCERPILELRGQFALLDSFYVDDDETLLESAGAWHARCLLDSPYGEAWFVAKRRNFVSVRRYEEVAELPECSVLRNPNTREMLAVQRTGMLLSLSFSNRPRRVADGFVGTVSEEYNLELADRDAIEAIQDALSGPGSFPLLALFEILGISDRVVHPEALERSVLRYARDTPGRRSRNFVCVRAEYGVFVAAALEPYIVRSEEGPCAVPARPPR